MSALTLYHHELDDQSYKVRLLLSILGVAHERVVVNAFPGREQLSATYLKISPRGAIPILRDEGVTLADAEAILAYLAKRHDATGQWLPQDDAAFGEVLSWLGFAKGELASASLARLHFMLDEPADEAVVVPAARRALRLMDDHMTKRELRGAAWFVGDKPTLADIALFPAIALSRDFGVDHDEYPALRRWMRRFRAIPGFRTMPGIPDYH